MNYYKLEFIIANVFLKQLITQLDKLGVGGYTIVEIIGGKGMIHGESLSSSMLPGSRNSKVFTVVNGEEKQKILTTLKEFIETRHAAVISYLVEDHIGLS